MTKLTANRTIDHFSRIYDEFVTSLALCSLKNVLAKLCNRESSRYGKLRVSENMIWKIPNENMLVKPIGNIF